MPTQATAARFTKVTEYRAEDVTISFVPTKDVPGFSHRVVLIHTATRAYIAHDWLGNSCSVTEKAAQYFYQKHIG